MVWKRGSQWVMRLADMVGGVGAGGKGAMLNRPAAGASFVRAADEVFGVFHDRFLDVVLNHGFRQLRRELGVFLPKMGVGLAATFRADHLADGIGRVTLRVAAGEIFSRRPEPGQ